MTTWKESIGIDWLADSLERSAEWRQEKAKEYPDDAQRNLLAADELEKLSVEVRKLDGTELHRRYHEAFLKEPDRMTEVEGELTRSVGFHRGYSSGEDLVEDIIEETLRWS